MEPTFVGESFLTQSERLPPPPDICRDDLAQIPLFNRVPHDGHVRGEMTLLLQLISSNCFTQPCTSLLSGW